MSKLSQLYLKIIKKRIKQYSNPKIENSPPGAVHIALLGTGGPMNNSKRIGATGIGIMTKDKFLLFDCGSGVLAKCRRHENNQEKNLKLYFLPTSIQII